MNNLHARMILALLIAASAIFALPRAQAATAKAGSGLSINRSGNIGTAGTGPATAGGNDFSRLMGGTYNPNMVDGSSEFSRLLDMPFKLKDLAPDKATVKGIITPANIAKGLRGGLAAYAAGQALEALMKEACVRGMNGTLQMSPSGAFQECVPGSGQSASESDGFEYQWWFGAPWMATKEEACAAKVADFAASNPDNTQISHSVTGLVCTYKYANSSGTQYTSTQDMNRRARTSIACPTGQYKLPDGSCSTTAPSEDVTWRDITPQAAETKLEDAIKKPANADKVADALKDALDKGAQFEIDAPNMTITGPASSPSVTSESTSGSGPDQLTTTSTSRNEYTYNGPNVTARETTTNVTRNQSGEVVSTSSSSQTPEEPVTDSPMPPVPKLYVRKYPDGIVGIWNEKSAAIKSSQLGTAAQSFMPAIADGGTCPSWPLDLSVASWGQFGVHDVAPPCWVWDFAKVVVLIGAGLFARRMIFGG